MNDEIGQHESSSQRTSDPTTIRVWAERRCGHPVLLRRAPRAEDELRIVFETVATSPRGRVEPITWEEFFRLFAARRLSFLYQEHTKSGEISRFCRIVEC